MGNDLSTGRQVVAELGLAPRALTPILVVYAAKLKAIHGIREWLSGSSSWD